MEATGSIHMDYEHSSNSNLSQPDQGTGRCYQQNEFDLKYGRIDKPARNAKSVVKSLRNKCRSSKECFLKKIFQVLPITRLIQTYRLREYALGDVVAGLTVGIMTVPQSMGYAILACVPPIFGLYTSCFPPIIYALLGSAPHLAMGVMALSSLMIGDVVTRETAHLKEELLNPTSNDTAELQRHLLQEQVTIALSVTLISGLVALVMSFLKLGFITSYLSSALMSGFFCGSNIRVLTHQVRLILGVSVKTHIGPLSYFFVVFDILKNIKQTNIAQLIISVICCVILVLVKKCVNERFQSRLKVPIPIDFIVVVIATIVSHFAKFEANFGVKIIKEIPKGVPAPVAPSMEKFSSLLLDGIALAIIGYITIYLMVKLFSVRHNLEVHPNQDLFAMAMCNVVCSFFSCLAASSSPPRCFVMESAGGRTQVAYLVSSVVVFLFLFFLAPLLESLPVCVLATLVIVACIPLFEHYTVSVYYWRTSVYDFAVYLSTVLGVLLFDISTGMVLAVAVSFFTVVLRTQYPYATNLAGSSDKDVLLDSKRYNICKDFPGVKIFRFEAPLYFPTVEIFREKLYAASIKPATVKAQRKKRTKGKKRYSIIAERKVNSNADQNAVETANSHEDEDCVNVETTTLNVPVSAPQPEESEARTALMKESEIPKMVIVDFTAIPFIDTAGGRALASLLAEFHGVDVKFVLAGCTETVRELLYRIPECKAVVTEAMFVSVLDALNSKTLQNLVSNQ